MTSRNHAGSALASLQEAVSAEVTAELAAGRRSTLSRDGIRPNRADLGKLILSGKAHLVAGAPDALPAYATLVDGCFEKLEAKIKEHNAAISGTVRYSDKARAATAGAWDLENALRRKLTDRLGNAPLAESIKRQCGVGTSMSPDAPLQVLDLGHKQLAELRKA